MVAVIDDQHGVGRNDLSAEERRRAVLAAFIGAGVPSPPSTALLVQGLAGEVRLRGIRENAAVLAVLEMPGRRNEIARAYREQHSDGDGGREGKGESR